MGEEAQTLTGVAHVNGARLYYETIGAGDPLLLIHAGIADSRMWDDQLDAFSQRYQVVRFDLRGFGRSDLPGGAFANHDDVRALLDWLGLKPVVALGISFGGLVALDFALAYPEYVKALVLAAPSVSGAASSDRIRQFWSEEEAALEAGELEKATELNLRLWVDGPHRQAHEVDAEVRRRVAAMQTAIFEREIPDDAEEVELDPPAIERLDEVKSPALVLIGDRDLDETLALADEIVDKMPDSHKVVIRGAGHMMSMEKPDEFTQQTLAFLTKVR